jgi:hypothetical protein
MPVLVFFWGGRGEDPDEDEVVKKLNNFRVRKVYDMNIYYLFDRSENFETSAHASCLPKIFVVTISAPPNTLGKGEGAGWAEKKKKKKTLWFLCCLFKVP